MDKNNFNFEEIRGEVINTEESTSNQKKEKLDLKITIAALCSAVILSGLELYSYQQSNIQEKKESAFSVSSLIAQEVDRINLDSQNNNVLQQDANVEKEERNLLSNAVDSTQDFGIDLDGISEFVNSMTDDEFNSWINSTEVFSESVEVSASDGYELKIFQKFIKNGIEWEKQGLVFTSFGKEDPIDNENEKYVFIGSSEKPDDKVVVYEEQTRDVSTGNDWKSTGNYVILNPLKKGYVPPINDANFRYVYLGTNSNSIEINAQLNWDEENNLFVTDITSQSNNDLEGRSR